MPITSFTVDGVEMDVLFETFEIRETVGNVSTLVGEVISVGSPVVRPSLFNEVIVQEDGVKIFAGTVKQRREQGFGGPNIYDETDGAPQISTVITAEDYTQFLERISIDEEVTEGTLLKAFLQTIVDDYLGPEFGVTLHGSQVNGPALPAMSFPRKKASEVVQALSDATGFISRIDYDKKLRMWEEGELTAPFNINEFDSPARWTDDVEVEEILGDDYANRVIVIVDLPVEVGHVETFAGDGVTSTFQLEYTLTNLTYFLIHVYELDGITPAGGETMGFEYETFDSDGNPVQWWYDPATNSITRNIGPTAADKIYKLTFDGFLHLEEMDEDEYEIADVGLYEHIETVTNITSAEAAQELATALLQVKLAAREKKLSYQSRFSAPTLRAGQQQTIAATARNVSGTFIIQDMVVRAETPATADYAAADLGLIRRVSAKQHNPMLGKWQHTYRDWLKVGGGAGIAIGDAGPTSTGPAPPLHSVQTNEAGAFYGTDHYTRDPNTHTVMIGLNHVPTGEDNLLVGEGHEGLDVGSP